MTYRPSDSSSRDCYSQPQSRLNQQIRCDSTDEGCPVFEESGTVCGETGSLGVFQEFRQMYDNCLKKLEGTPDGCATLRKLAPFKKIIDDLWEQNTMLVETVEELEQEATCKVTNLQDKLNKSCQKVREYEEDIKSLTKVIQRYCEKGVFDTTGLKFNTFSPKCAFRNCENSESCPNPNFSEVNTKALPLLKSRTNCVDEGAIKTICAPPKKLKEGKYNPCKTTSRSMVPFPKRLDSTNARNANLPKSYINDLFRKPLCSNVCSENNSYKNLNRSKPTSDERDCQECKGSVNINSNLGKDSLVSSTDCCCGCSCSFSSSETNDY